MKPKLNAFLTGQWGTIMRFRLLATCGLVVYLLIACIPLLAHHGGIAYNTEKAVVLKGTVTKWVWINPHSFVQFDVKDAQGNVQHWAAEASSPSTLQLMGWSQASMKPGDTITVYLYQAKSGKLVGRMNKLVLSDGTKLKDGQQGYREVK